MNCRICQSPSNEFAKGVILQKYLVQYYRCSHCGFIETEKPYWLAEAYTESIARSDLGLISRNFKVSAITAVIISVFFNSSAKFLDYGGGNGMLVRLMRDKGFNFFWQDRFTQNQFARGFELREDAAYELVTAFEVFEHLENPLDEIDKMLTYSDNILFSTTLVPSKTPKPEEWWYYTLDTGQHISLYTKAALLEIARNFNLNLYTNGRSTHLLSKKKFPSILFFPFSIGQVAEIVWPILSKGKKSLVESDYYQLTGKNLK